MRNMFFVLQLGGNFENHILENQKSKVNRKNESSTAKKSNTCNDLCYFLQTHVLTFMFSEVRRSVLLFWHLLKLTNSV